MRESPKNCLLLGNGLNRSFGQEDWYAFLEKITTERMKELLFEQVGGVDPSGKKATLYHILQHMNCPAPLLATLITEDHLDTSLRKKSGLYLTDSEEENAPWTIDLDIQQQAVFSELLTLDLEDIFTTNYTYELEMAEVYPEQFTRSMRKKMQKHTSAVLRAEGKYAYHTYSFLKNANKRVWHIHGEMDKPDSMILGHYYYSKNIYHMETMLNHEPIKPDNQACDDQSWLKLFLTSNIFCLGFSFDLSEHDMWWLLNRKAREKENCGKVYFYAPKPKEFDIKTELLRVMKNAQTGEPLVEVVTLGRDEKDGVDWPSFYRDAINDIQKRLSMKCSEEVESEKELVFV